MLMNTLLGFRFMLFEISGLIHWSNFRTAQISKVSMSVLISSEKVNEN